MYVFLVISNFLIIQLIFSQANILHQDNLPAKVGPTHYCHFPQTDIADYAHISKLLAGFLHHSTAVFSQAICPNPSAISWVLPIRLGDARVLLNEESELGK